jgi:hypothetical protein
MNLNLKVLSLVLTAQFVLAPLATSSEQVKPDKFEPPKNSYGKNIYPFAPFETNFLTSKVKVLAEDQTALINFHDIVRNKLSSRKTTNAINPGQQPWMSTYWPLNKGLVADPYSAKINVARLDKELSWSGNHSRLEKRVTTVHSKWQELEQDDLDELAPSEKYDILLGDEDFTLTAKARKFMYDWGSKKENAFLSKIEKVGGESLLYAQNYVENRWVNGDNQPFSSKDESLPLAIRNKGGLAEIIATYLQEEGLARSFEEAIVKAIPLAKIEQHNYVIKPKNSLMALWEGICHGWSTAAGIVPRPHRIVEFNLPNRKKLRFYPDDLKALASYMFANSTIQDGRYYDEASDSYQGGGILMEGLRCNESRPAIDPWGRYYDDKKDAFSDQLEPRCVGVHPAIWHLSLVNILGKQGRSFVVERKIKDAVDNHPLSGYDAKYFNPYTGDYEASLTKNIQPIGPNDQFYKFRNPHATHIVGVRLTMTYVNWERPKREATDSPAKDSMRDIEMLYDLELDRDGNIIGGQWRAKEVGRANVFNKERTQPDFFWIVTKDWRPFFKATANLPYWDGKSLPPVEYKEAAIKAAQQKYYSAHDRCELEKATKSQLNKNLPKYIKVNCEHNYDKPQPLVDVVRKLIERSNNQGQTF